MNCSNGCLQLVCPQPLHDRHPRDVELACGRGRASARNAVRLLDEHDRRSDGFSRARCCEQVRCSHAPAGAVAENQRGPCVVVRLHVRARRAVRRLDVDRPH